MRLMSGFAGEFLFGQGPARADRQLAMRAAQQLRHKCQDEIGSYLSTDGRCAISCDQLCTIDPTGSQQPTTSAGGVVALALDGKIYNSGELRTELAGAGAELRTSGDQEVLLALYLRHGLGMLGMLEGSFALAIHDSRKGQLHLVRDRLGVRHVWYALTDNGVVFSTEGKSLPACGKAKKTIDAEALGMYLTVGYIPAPRSIWAGVCKLRAGHHVSFGTSHGRPQCWWQPPTAAKPMTRDAAIEAVTETLADSVAKCLATDVPFGVLLSGGVDSSIVAALVCRAIGEAGAVKSFTAGFAESRFDERPFARRVAEQLGTSHHEIVLTASAGDLLDELVSQYDEPFGDSGVLATVLLCRAAGEHVGMALCGDGGDEAFAGYDRHRAMWLGETMSPMKASLMTAAGVLADSFAPRDEKSSLRRFARFARAMDAPPALRYLSYRELFGPLMLDELLTDELAEQFTLTGPRDWFTDLYEQGECDSELLAAQRHDVLTYLPDDQMVKADITGAAGGLELRSPMLDYRITELGMSLPAELKVSRRRGKVILREAFAHMLPVEVFQRPKAGFGVPIDSWLRGPMLGMLKETLLDQSFIDTGWLKRTALTKLIDSHIAGEADHRHRLWALLWLGRWHALQR